jgi:predicted GNAT family acetyltransferase
MIGPVATDVRDEPGRSRYEVSVDGQVVGFAEYRLLGHRAHFHHTFIDPVWRGRRLAEVLVRSALDDARQAGRTIVPECWYVAGFIERHPEYADLVADAVDPPAGQVRRGDDP